MTTGNASGEQDDASKHRMSRRAMLGAATAVTAGVGGYLAARVTGGPQGMAEPAEPELFDGVHQPGIVTAAQRHVCVAAFDVVKPSRAQLTTLMDRWGPMAAALMRGEPGPTRPRRDVADSGIADDLGTESLTITFGFGPRVFDDTFALGAPPPKRLRELPPFPGDRLDPKWTGGDIVVQVCADDPTVVAHAMREIRARAPGVATARWTHFGFVTVPAGGGTPRNLFGQLDGTANLRPGTPEFDQSVWAAGDEPEWMHGGTYLVFRKIRMFTPMWDLTTAEVQNAAVGRDRHTGAPLSGGTEHTPLDLDKTGADGNPLIAADAHVRLAHDAPRIFRRAYNYDNGLVLPASAGIPDDGHVHPPGTAPHDHGQSQPGLGHWDSGLLFMTYVRDPQTLYVPLQQRLSRGDRLHTFLRHTGSAVFALPGATSSEDHPGRRLLG